MNVEQLTQLAEPLIPPQAHLWPPAPWVIILACALVAFILAILVWRWYQATHLRRFAYAELEAIKQKFDTNQDSTRYLHEINLLLRRLAVRNFGRDKAAALVGDDWLEFLDWSLGKLPKNELGFQQGSGKVLARAAYQAEPVSFEIEPLHFLVRRWIRKQT